MGVTKLKYAEIVDSIVILTEEDDEILEMYVFVNTLIKSGKAVKCVVAGASDLMKNSICALMYDKEKYDIFESDIESVDNEYLADIQEIQQEAEEAEMYIDKRIIEYGKISKKLLEKDDEDAKVGSEYIEYLKQILENGNTDNKINVLARDMEKKISTQDEEIEKLKIEIEIKDKNIKQLEGINKELKDSLISNNDNVASYVTVNTVAVGSKIKYILYFKEISYVRYMNTFIKAFMRIFEILKVNARLLIQDVRDDTNAKYEGIPVVDDKFYTANREKLLDSSREFVVVSRSTMVIEDVLKTNCDVLVIYDRTGIAQDLISGAITKFFVVGSAKELETSKRFRIDMTNTFCYYDDSDKGIYISKIPDFNNLNENARIAKINKLTFVDKASKGDAKRIVEAVYNRAHIDISSMIKR